MGDRIFDGSLARIEAAMNWLSPDEVRACLAHSAGRYHIQMRDAIEEETKMTCECCWEARGWSETDYYVVMARHEAAKCPCTQDTPEGKRRRAGQFWDEAKQRDSREDAMEGKTK